MNPHPPIVIASNGDRITRHVQADVRYHDMMSPPTEGIYAMYERSMGFSCLPLRQSVQDKPGEPAVEQHLHLAGKRLKEAGVPG